MASWTKIKVNSILADMGIRICEPAYQKFQLCASSFLNRKFDMINILFSRKFSINYPSVKIDCMILAPPVCLRRVYLLFPFFIFFFLLESIDCPHLSPSFSSFLSTFSSLRISQEIIIILTEIYILKKQWSFTERRTAPCDSWFTKRAYLNGSLRRHCYFWDNRYSETWKFLRGIRPFVVPSFFISCR